MLRCSAQGHGLFCAVDVFRHLRRRSSRPHTRHYARQCPLCPRLITPHLFLKGGIRLITISLFRGQSVTLITVDRIPPLLLPVLVLLLCLLRQSLELKDTRGGGVEGGVVGGGFRIDICTIFDRGGNQQAEILKETERGKKKGAKGRQTG